MDDGLMDRAKGRYPRHAKRGRRVGHDVMRSRVVLVRGWSPVFDRWMSWCARPMEPCGLPDVQTERMAHLSILNSLQAKLEQMIKWGRISCNFLRGLGRRTLFPRSFVAVLATLVLSSVIQAQNGYTTPADVNGNGTYDFQEVTTVAITCPGNRTAFVDAGTCGAVMVIAAPTVTGFCGYVYTYEQLQRNGECIRHLSRGRYRGGSGAATGRP